MTYHKALASAANESVKALCEGRMQNDLLTAYLSQGGKVTQLPYGNAVRDTDGESWKQTNDRKWQVKQDKERAIE